MSRLLHRAGEDHLPDYLTPEGQLRSALKVSTYTSDGPEARWRVLVIEPDGAWRVTSAIGGGGTPLRQGKLTAEQLQLLGLHLAAQKFTQCPPVLAPLLPTDKGTLEVDFGLYRVTCVGLQSATLRTAAPPVAAWEAEARVRLEALILALDDLTGGGVPRLE